MKKLIPFLALSSSVFAAPQGMDVIYGEDGRKEVYEASATLQKLALSTPTMIPTSNLSLNSATGKYDTNQTSFSTWLEGQFKSLSIKNLNQSEESSEAEEIDADDQFRLGFCADERFTSQPNPGMCSGFLIAPDLIVTAGHCTAIERSCEDYKWVFDFKQSLVTQKAGVGISPENIYSCKKIIRSSLNMMVMSDYAVIQLDRKVKGREPLNLRLSGKIETGAPLVVVGNPSGLPLKITEGGNVRVNNHPMFFDANLDTYQGNSGSAVFNANTLEVEGILVRGDTDFVFDPVNACITSNKCTDEGCRGESVSRISSIPEVALYGLMFRAVENQNLNTLKQALDLGVWVDFNLAKGETLLMEAAGLRSAEMIELLLQKGASVSATDKEGNAALHYLAKNMNTNDLEPLTKLINAGANLSAKNNKGQTPAAIALEMGHFGASLLLDFLSK